MIVDFAAWYAEVLKLTPNQFNKLEVYVAALLENQWSDMRTPDWDQICDSPTVVDVCCARRRNCGSVERTSGGTQLEPCAVQHPVWRAPRPQRVLSYSQHL